MKRISLSLKLAHVALRAHMTRSVLTIIGIVIGIALTTIVMSVGSAIEAFIIGQVESFGSDVLSVEVRAPGKQDATGIVITTLKESDARAIREVPNIASNYAGVISQAVVAHDGITKKTMLFGVSASYLDVDAAKVEQGRFFTEGEDGSLARVAVIGRDIATSFFGENDPLNEYIRINNSSYRVVGVLEQRGASGFFDRDNLVYLPLRTLQKRIDGIDHVSFIVSKLVDPDRAVDTRLQIEELMRERHRISDPDKDDFAVYTIEEARELVGQIILGIQILLIALAGISLVVGGIGIMNIMYVAVSERTYEIGLRKAIGAKNRDILLQFLAEATMLTLAGGVIGIVFGIGVSYGVAIIARSLGFSWQFIITPASLIIPVVFSFIVGATFGLHPARKASRLNPIQALRYE